MDPQYSLHTVSHGDVVVIIISFALFALTFLLLADAWLFHTYPPIRIKYLPLVSLIYLSGIGWFLGTLQTAGLVDVAGVWANCKAWSVWVRLLGGYTFLALLVVHAFTHYYRLTVRESPDSSRMVFLGASLLVLPLSVCTVGQVLPPESSAAYVDSLQICWLGSEYQLATLGVSVAIMSIYCIALFKLHTSKCCFNEVYEYLAILIVVLARIAKSIALCSILPALPLDKHARRFSVLYDVATAISVIWILLLTPVYKCLVDHKRYERMWAAKLTADGLWQEYEVDIQRACSYVECLSLSRVGHSGLVAEAVPHTRPRGFFPSSTEMGVELRP
ncbi:hypothetical protein EC988_003738, partial [Linderina pennispora]